MTNLTDVHETLAFREAINSFLAAYAKGLANAGLVVADIVGTGHLHSSVLKVYDESETCIGGVKMTVLIRFEETVTADQIERLAQSRTAPSS